MLRDGERLDDLQYNGLKVIQDTRQFCFGTDSVALANFVTGKPGERAVDLGCGNGVISILTAAKCGFHVTAVEIQPAAAELARRNVVLNGLEDKVDVREMPMQDAPAALGRNFDVVMTNPPYRRVTSGYTQENEAVRRARFEIDVDLEGVVESAAGLLKPGGRLYTVYPVERLAELVTACSVRELTPKVLRFLSKKIFLMQCVVGARHGLLFL